MTDTIEEIFKDSEAFENLTEEQPEKKTLDPNWKFWQRIITFTVDLVVKLALIVAFIVGYFEYNENKRNNALNAAYDLVNNWETGGYRNSMEELSYFVGKIKMQFATDHSNQSDNELLERAFVTNRLLEVSNSNQEIDAKIRHVFYFFGKTGVCVEQSICNADVIDGFFLDSAEDFLYYFLPYAHRKRANGQPEFGQITENFVQR